VVLLDAAGLRLKTMGAEGNGNGQLKDPLGIGLGPRGEVFVADKGNNRLAVFDAEGNFRRNIALADAAGKAVRPIDVAVSADGKELFVSTNEHQVLVVSDRGKLLRAWGEKGEEDGQFNYPGTIALDGAGKVYVVDVINQRVQVFDAAGAHQLSIGALGVKPGDLFRPKGVAVDAAGNVYVGDSYTGVIQVFGPDGAFKAALGEAGAPKRFDTPLGMTVYEGRLYVAQMLAGTVLVLETGVAP